MMSRRRFLGDLAGALPFADFFFGDGDQQPVPEIHILSGEFESMFHGVGTISYKNRPFRNPVAEIGIDVGRSHGAGYIEIAGSTGEGKITVPVGPDDVSIAPLTVYGDSSDGAIRLLLTLVSEGTDRGQVVVVIDPDGEWR